MFSVLSANRSKAKNKSWRVFEKKNLEKYFGKVLDVDAEDGFSVLDSFTKYQESIKFIRWYPDPENLTKDAYKGMLNQSEKIGNHSFISSSTEGFKYAQCKDKAFAKWKEHDIPIPDFFSFKNKDEFYKGLEISNVSLPFLIRINNGVSGLDSFKITETKELNYKLNQILKLLENNYSIDPCCFCVELIDTIDRKHDVNHSFRIHVSGDRVISGYGRVSNPDDWVAISGKFDDKISDAWIEYNVKCENLMNNYEDLIVKAVNVLDQNVQGVDLVLDQSGKIFFLEVQPTYSSGYPFWSKPFQSYKKPFYNPYQKDLVNFIKKNRSFLEKNCPKYFYNWLDKDNHFNEVYKSLANKTNVWA